MSVPLRAARNGSVNTFLVSPSALAIAMRIAIILTCLALIASFTVAALVQSEPPKMALATCEGLGNDASRLACYDELARRSLPQPAKGASPPTIVSRPLD